MTIPLKRGGIEPIIKGRDGSVREWDAWESWVVDRGRGEMGLESEWSRGLSASLAENLRPILSTAKTGGVRASSSASVKAHELWVEIMAQEAKKSLEEVGGPLAKVEDAAWQDHLGQVFDQSAMKVQKDFYGEKIPHALVQRFRSSIGSPV